MFLSPWGVFGQLRLKIVSETDSLKLPYATISNFSKRQIYSTDEHGEIQLNAIRGDTFQISYVGYKNVEFIYEKDKDKNKIPELSEKISELTFLKKLIINSHAKPCKLNANLLH